MSQTTSLVTAASAGRRGAIHRFFRNPLGVAAAAVLVLLIVAALVAPLLPLPSPDVVSLRDAMLPLPGRTGDPFSEVRERPVLRRPQAVGVPCYCQLLPP